MRKGSFKKIIVLLVVAATAVVMLLTCPAKEAHCDAVDQELSDIVMEGFYSNPGMESFAPLAGLFMPSVVSSPSRRSSMSATFSSSLPAM